TDPAFDAFCAKYKRAVGTTYLMTVAASEPSPFQQRVLQQADVQRAVALARQACSTYPEGRATYEWALLRNADAGEAARIADVIRKTPRDAIDQSIATLLNPTSAGEALDAYWLARILGKPDEGKAALAKVAAMDVPVPIQP
ncbi:MAG TPA: hypothetical protein VGI81_02080, partial [Tepidisphaeraceae bacterium]